MTSTLWNELQENASAQSQENGNHLKRHLDNECYIPGGPQPLYGQARAIPIGGIQGFHDTLVVKTRSLEVLGYRLLHLHLHDALCHLRPTFAIPKLLYTFCTSPCFHAPELQVFESLLISLLSSILNISLNDSAWSQASLPIWYGGLGVPSAILLAPTAFFASAAVSADLLYQILLPRLQILPDKLRA